MAHATSWLAWTGRGIASPVAIAIQALQHPLTPWTQPGLNRRIRTTIGLGTTAALAAVVAHAPARATTLTGTASYPERIALPPDMAARPA